MWPATQLACSTGVFLSQSVTYVFHRLFASSLARSTSFAAQGATFGAQASWISMLRWFVVHPCQWFSNKSNSVYKYKHVQRFTLDRYVHVFTCKSILLFKSCKLLSFNYYWICNLLHLFPFFQLTTSAFSVQVPRAERRKSAIPEPFACCVSGIPRWWRWRAWRVLMRRRT